MFFHNVNIVFQHHAVVVVVVVAVVDHDKSIVVSEKCVF